MILACEERVYRNFNGGDNKGLTRGSHKFRGKSGKFRIGEKRRNDDVFSSSSLSLVGIGDFRFSFSFHEEGHTLVLYLSKVW